ncbi:MAG: DUF2891 family protein [Planctomycetota bacterium]
MIRTALLLGLLAASQDAPQASPPPPATEVEPTDAVLARMLELMRDGLDVREPSTAFPARMERSTIFDGSYDWHSCVIAHWALLVQARWDGDAEADRWVRERLVIDDLEYESDTIVKRPSRILFTWPYDEAWFLMLLSELERSPAEDPEERARLRELREVHEERLLDALAERDFPELQASADSDPEIFVGFYFSWLWAYLLVHWSEPITAEGSERLAELRASKFLPARKLFAERSFEATPYDFLWVPALFELEEPGWNGEYDPGELPDWPAEVSLRDVHVLGRELCRIWPLVGQPVATQRVASLLAREDLWAGDFQVVSHWMPQFLFLGRWFRLRK